MASNQEVVGSNPAAGTIIVMDLLQYLALLIIGMCIAYGVLYVLFPFFFKNTLIPFHPKSFLSLLTIICLSILLFAISFLLLDGEWGNRFLHAFGGGFLSMFICFRVVKDTALALPRFQFFIFSALVVTAMGVGNEIIEYFLQDVTLLEFLPNPNDTWLDLMSNLIGTLIGSALFVPFIKKQ